MRTHNRKHSRCKRSCGKPGCKAIMKKIAINYEVSVLSRIRTDIQSTSITPPFISYRRRFRGLQGPTGRGTVWPSPGGTPGPTAPPPPGASPKPQYIAPRWGLRGSAHLLHIATHPRVLRCAPNFARLGVARTLTQACLPQPLPPACAVSASLRQSAERAALSDQLLGVAPARQLTVSSASPFPAPSRQHAHSSQCRRW